MSDQQTTVEILLAYAYSKEDAQKAAQLVEEYQDKTLRAVMSKERQIAAKAHLANMVRSKKQAEELAKVKVDAERKASAEIDRIDRERIANMTAEQKAAVKKSWEEEIARRNAQQAEYQRQDVERYRERKARQVPIVPIGFEQAQLENSLAVNAEKNAMASRSAVWANEKKNADIQKKAAQEVAKAKKQEAELTARILKMNEKADELLKRDISGKDKANKEREASAKRVKQIESEISREYAKQMRQVGILRQQSEILNRTGRGLTIGGLAITGGMFALGAKEANRQKDLGQTTQLTKDWLTAQLRIEKSTERIGQVAEAVVLPAFELLAGYTEKASKYLASHPEIAKIAFGAGVVAVAMGTLLTVASKGIRIYSDIKFEAVQLAHTKAMNKLADQMAIDVLKSKSGVGGLGGTVSKLAGGAGGATAASIAGTVAIVLAVIAAGAVLGAIAYDLIAKLAPKLGLPRFGAVAAGGANIAGKGIEKVAVAGGMSESEAKRKTLVFTYLVGRVFGAIKEGDPAWKSVADGAKKAAGALDDLSGSEENLAKQAEGWKVMRDLEQANIDAEIAYNQKRADVMRDATQSVTDANRSFTRNALKIRTDLASTEKKLTADFNSANIQAEQQYQQERAQVIQQGAEQIKQIQVNAQEQLRQLEEDHAKRLLDITGNRDALAFVKENEDYENQKGEIKASKNREIAERKRDTAQQLKDLMVSNAQQRVERVQQYNAAILDARAQAKQQLAENAASHREQIAQIMQARNQQLADLQRSYNEERRQRIQDAYNKIKDIQGATEAERALKLRYYGMMLTDVNSFMTQYQNALNKRTAGASSGFNGSRASGGYVNKGIYQMHDKEWVANRETTGALEKMIGGRLTQQNVMSLGRGSASSVVWNDHRSFSGDYTPAMKKAVEVDTMNLLQDILRPA